MFFLLVLLYFLLLLLLLLLFFWFLRLLIPSVSRVKAFCARGTLLSEVLILSCEVFMQAWYLLFESVFAKLYEIGCNCRHKPVNFLIFLPLLLLLIQRTLCHFFVLLLIFVEFLFKKLGHLLFFLVK